ncbi:MAG TPA: ATP-dependent metallopeptidase FtsH/Yme1/Tma family protein, partial [bacterium]|nr:ATP-dependent metallopeptidase FtsH/Yme1/Tma family protein [bacterium]
MPPPGEERKAPRMPGWVSIAVTVAWIALFAWVFAIPRGAAPRVLAYSEFKTLVAAGRVSEVAVSTEAIRGTLVADAASGAKAEAFSTLRVDDPKLLEDLQERKVVVRGEPGVGGFGSWGRVLLGAGLLLLLFGFFRRGATGLPSAALFGKSHARIYAEKEVGVTFADVAGADEAIEELQEVITFLKEPEKFNRLGGKMPKGILLVGPPGTGKTLLARAVAGEAGVPFFSISGSEFVELFVGVGAARVRDLFHQAKERAPCIIFIDELDALGKTRVAGPMAHEEREQTLNQLLVELDGFDPRGGVVLMAATNRPEILDAALLRAGRFDRRVVIDRPERAGRRDILALHAKKVPLAKDVDLDEVAGMTPGMAGADLANLINEAALLAVRRGKDEVGMAELVEALERGVAGMEKRTRILGADERRRVAVHELGHALVARALPGADPVRKISIIPRG